MHQEFRAVKLFCMNDTKMVDACPHVQTHGVHTKSNPNADYGTGVTMMCPGSSVVTHMPLWQEVLMMGKAVPMQEQKEMGSILSVHFCYESKTALKKIKSIF